MIETNIIHHGDNLEIMQSMDSEFVDLIYADPPFFTQKDWEDFDDRFESMDDYIGFMRARIQDCHRILKPTGSIYLQCDWHASHYLKVMMDDIFGYKNFVSDIRWRRCHPKGCSKLYANNSDSILFYSKNRKDVVFNPQYTPYKDNTLKLFKYNDNDGRGDYSANSVGSIATVGYIYDLGFGEKMPKNGYRWKWDTMQQKIADGLVIIREGLVPRQKTYRSDCAGVPLDDMWVDITGELNKEYQTQKPIKLLERIVNVSSTPGDIVLDPFCGSGTTLIAAESLGRRYIGIDKNQDAIDITNSRLKGSYQQCI